MLDTEARITDGTCHFSLFGQGCRPPRLRLRPSNKRRLVTNESAICPRTGVRRQHLQARWKSPSRKSHPLRLAARAGHVRGERHAGHAHCKRRRLQRPGIHSHRHGSAHSGRHARRRYRHAGSAVPGLAHRLAPAGRDGPELHVPVRDDDAGREGLWLYDRRGDRGRLYRGLTWIDREILAAVRQPDRLGVCRDDDRLQPALDRYLLVREFLGLSHRRVAESARRGHHARGVPRL